MTRIQNYLSDQGVPFSMHEHPTAYTAQEVAASEHVSGRKVAKAVIVRAEDKFAMCVLPAHLKLDLTKVSHALHAAKVRLADEADLADHFPEDELGAEPPFGNLYEMPTLLDPHLAEDEEIVFPAGTHRQSIHMRYSDYASVVHPTVQDIAVQL